jgi:hypothetical protein
MDRDSAAAFAAANAVADPVEIALAAALQGATAAGEWGIVAQLAAELEARRRARADVPTLADERARRGTR